MREVGTAPATRRRLLAPDFARSSMLLMIVLSNTALFLYGGTHERSVDRPYPTTAADGVTQFLMTALMERRGVQGPFERLLRHLTSRKASRPAATGDVTGLG